MKEFTTQKILKITKAEQILQFNLVLIYVIFTIVKYGRLGEWFEFGGMKNSELVEEYIASLEWFQVIQNESNKT